MTPESLRFYARSASDKTEDWPFWYIADRHRGDLNVTANLIRELIGQEPRGAVFLSRDASESLAKEANKRGATND